MKAYLDNVTASGRILADLNPQQEMGVVRWMEQAALRGELEIVTSREAWREQDRTRDPGKRAKLVAARSELPIVPRDHDILFINTVYDRLGGFVSSPVFTEIVDQTMFNDLRKLGLDEADARHLMYAAANACDRFVTLDPDFLDRRADLEGRCPGVRIVKPSELVEELTLAESSLPQVS